MPSRWTRAQAEVEAAAFADEEPESLFAGVLAEPESDEPEEVPVELPAAAVSFEPDSEPPDFAEVREPPEERESVA